MRATALAAAATAAILLVGGMPGAVQAQQASQPAPILTLDQERLFDESSWGKRVIAETEADLARPSGREPQDRGRADRRGKRP